MWLIEVYNQCNTAPSWVSEHELNQAEKVHSPWDQQRRAWKQEIRYKGDLRPIHAPLMHSTCLVVCLFLKDTTIIPHILLRASWWHGWKERHPLQGALTCSLDALVVRGKNGQPCYSWKENLSMCSQCLVIKSIILINRARLCFVCYRFYMRVALLQVFHRAYGCYFRSNSSSGP